MQNSINITRNSIHQIPFNNNKNLFYDYEKLIKIGQGSFATVYRTKHLITGKYVAIKAIALQKLNKKLISNLESEINIMRKISHDNILSLYDIRKSKNHVYLMLEYCDYGDFHQYLRKKKKLDEKESQFFLKQLVNGLYNLYKNHLIHRDLKPQNLLLTTSTSRIIDPSAPMYTRFDLKIADFGFARYLEATSMADTLCGSPLYMAPEILRYQKYDAKADLWSVGAILYQMVYGKPPFSGRNHLDLLANIEKKDLEFPDDVQISQDCKYLLQCLLRRDPINRISFEDFFQAKYLNMKNENDTKEMFHSIPLTSSTTIPIDIPNKMMENGETNDHNIGKRAASSAPGKYCQTSGNKNNAYNLKGYDMNTLSISHGKNIKRQMNQRYDINYMDTLHDESTNRQSQVLSLDNNTQNRSNDRFILDNTQNQKSTQNNSSFFLTKAKNKLLHSGKDRFSPPMDSSGEYVMIGNKEIHTNSNVGVSTITNKTNININVLQYILKVKDRIIAIHNVADQLESTASNELFYSTMDGTIKIKNTNGNSTNLSISSASSSSSFSGGLMSSNSPNWIKTKFNFLRESLILYLKCIKVITTVILSMKHYNEGKLNCKNHNEVNDTEMESQIRDLNTHFIQLSESAERCYESLNELRSRIKTNPSLSSLSFSNSMYMEEEIIFRHAKSLAKSGVIKELLDQEIEAKEFYKVSLELLYVFMEENEKNMKAVDLTYVHLLINLCEKRLNKLKTTHKKERDK